MSLLASYIPSRLMRRRSHPPSGFPSAFPTAATTAAPSSLGSHIEVCPPRLWPSSLTLWGRVQRWLVSERAWTPESMRPGSRLRLARREFERSMDRLQGTAAARLSYQIECARSLRELWHLRSTLYGLLAQQFDQSGAERCMAVLNRHFPSRAPRSGFGRLGN